MNLVGYLYIWSLILITTNLIGVTDINNWLVFLPAVVALILSIIAAILISWVEEIKERQNVSTVLRK